MTDRPKEEATFSLETPPGDEWALLNSGGAPAKIHKGSRPPEQWLTEETGHIFARNGKTNEWLGYLREENRFVALPEEWQTFATNVWQKESASSLAEARETIRSQLEDLFDKDNRINWSEFFKSSNPYNKTRADVFPNGTGNMSKVDIINYIKQNHRLFLAGGVDPLEFPELIDEGFKSLCDTINQTTWGRTYDGCTGHPANEKGHSLTGYGASYLRIALDLNDPLANKYIDEVEKLAKEWEQKHKTPKANLHRENVVPSDDKPRIIYHSVTLNIDPPNDTEECHQVSAGFFDELNKRVATIKD